MDQPAQRQTAPDLGIVMVLPCSRHVFVRPVIHLDQHAWTEAQGEAFRFFNGVPRRLVPDNLRTGVDLPGEVRAAGHFGVGRSSGCGSWLLVITNPSIRRIFTVTGLHVIFPIYDSLDTAKFAHET
ncbi:hypothetical protein [Streptomyces sp. NPDC058424]|uniref:hypothetical protein n=1 Tax=Streptomyces sp. NPDC058424 TaxID=3346491 RepID=UPI003651FC56